MYHDIYRYVPIFAVYFLRGRVHEIEGDTTLTALTKLGSIMAIACRRFDTKRSPAAPSLTAAGIPALQPCAQTVSRPKPRVAGSSVTRALTQSSTGLGSRAPAIRVGRLHNVSTNRVHWRGFARRAVASIGYRKRRTVNRLRPQLARRQLVA